MSKQIGNLEVPEIINKYDAYGNICSSNEQYYHNRKLNDYGHSYFEPTNDYSMSDSDFKLWSTSNSDIIKIALGIKYDIKLGKRTKFNDFNNKVATMWISGIALDDIQKYYEDDLSEKEKVCVYYWNEILKRVNSNPIRDTSLNMQRLEEKYHYAKELRDETKEDFKCFISNLMKN